MKRSDISLSCPPRCLRRAEAATYIAISTGTFDKLVMSGDLPGPLKLGNISLWDRRALDAKIDELANAYQDASGWE